MVTYAESIDILEEELMKLLDIFKGLTPDEWELETRLEPIDATQRHWTVFELAGHFDISIGLTRMLIADPTDGQVGRDRASFFIFPRSEVAPVVYDYAYTMVAGKKHTDMPGVLDETFGKTIEEARAVEPTLVGPGYYALMEVGEFVPSRVVEAVVHGFDLTDALGHAAVPSPAAVSVAAEILDDLLARRTVAGRPADLREDLAWVRAASGRAPHDDPRLPLIG